MTQDSSFMRAVSQITFNENASFCFACSLCDIVSHVLACSYYCNAAAEHVCACDSLGFAIVSHFCRNFGFHGVGGRRSRFWGQNRVGLP